MFRATLALPRAAARAFPWEEERNEIELSCRSPTATKVSRIIISSVTTKAKPLFPWRAVDEWFEWRMIRSLS